MDHEEQMILPDLNYTPPQVKIAGDEVVPDAGDGIQGQVEHEKADDVVGARDLPVVQADAQQVDEADAQQEHKEVVHQSQKKDLPDHYRFAAYIALKALSKDREIQKKDKEHVADLLNTSLRTVDRIWKDANDQIARGEEVDVSSKKKGRCGRKRVDLDLSRISSIPLDKKSSMRALASSLEVPVSTLYRRFKWGDIRRHKSSLRPHVKRANKIDKLKLCISFLDKGTLTNEKGK